MSAIEACHIAALGGHVEGGHHRIAYNSRRNRHCPKCQAAAAHDWLAARKADLLPVGYFHVVFSVPADIALQNKAALYDLLFKAASETMLAIAADPRQLGARTGMTAVLHSWGSALTHHPHAAPGDDRLHAEPRAVLTLQACRTALGGLPGHRGADRGFRGRARPPSL